MWPWSLQHDMFVLGLVPVVLENSLEGDELRTDIEAMRAAISRLGAENIACVMTTTSCFAPRLPDRSAIISIYFVLYWIITLFNFSVLMQCFCQKLNLCTLLMMMRIVIMSQYGSFSTMWNEYSVRSNQNYFSINQTKLGFIRLIFLCHI